MRAVFQSDSSRATTHEGSMQINELIKSVLCVFLCDLRTQQSNILVITNHCCFVKAIIDDLFDTQLHISLTLPFYGKAASPCSKENYVLLRGNFIEHTFNTFVFDLILFLLC